jgi:NitT/TauT family transport system ATP-binding protein
MGENRFLLEVRGLHKVFEKGRRRTVAIGSLTFSIAEREFLAIVGPSGCGKTSLLRCVAGLSRPTEGEVLLRGKRVEEPPPAMVLVFQDYGRALCPWRTILGNVLLPLEHGELPRDLQRERALEALRLVGLEGFQAHYPWELSGGMQQRLQIARALAYRAEIMLMDEPFGSLDALTRAELEDQFLEIWSSYPSTILFVTHDIEEAVYLADRVLILSSRPCRVVDEIRITLPRPRHQIQTRTDSRFAEYRSAILTRIWSLNGAPSADPLAGDAGGGT